MKGGGPIKSISINKRNFSVAGDSKPGRIQGGNKNSVSMNGDSTARIIVEIGPSKISGVAIQIDDDDKDQEFVQDIVNLGEFVDVTITYTDGKSWYAQMTVTEDLEYDPATGTMEITLEGTVLKQQ